MKLQKATNKLEVHGDLHIDLDGETVQINATGEEIRIHASSLLALRHLADAASRGDLPWEPWLTSSGLTLEILVEGVSVAKLGSGADPNWLGAVSGVSGSEVSLIGVLRSLLR